MKNRLSYILGVFITVGWYAPRAIADDGSRVPFETLIRDQCGDKVYMAIDATNIYWSGNCSTEMSPCLREKRCTKEKIDKLMGAPKSGKGEPITIGELDKSTKQLLVDDQHFYWLYEDGIKKMKKGGHEITNLASSQRSFPYAAAMVGDALYWVNYRPRRIFMIDKSGQLEKSLVDVFETDKTTYDNSYVYWTTGLSSIKRIKQEEGSQVETLTDNLPENSPREMAVDDQYVYVAIGGSFNKDQTSFMGDGAIVKVNKKNGAVISLASFEAEPHELVLDKENVYWTTEFEVKKISKNGGHSIILASGQIRPENLRVDESHVYWTTQGEKSSLEGYYDGSYREWGTSATLRRTEKSPRVESVTSSVVKGFSKNNLADTTTYQAAFNEGISDDNSMKITLEGQSQDQRLHLSGIVLSGKGRAIRLCADAFVRRAMTGKFTVCCFKKYSSHQQLVGEAVSSSGVNINNELVRLGYAWCDKDNLTLSEPYRAAEEEARRWQRGIWGVYNLSTAKDFKRIQKKQATHRAQGFFSGLLWSLIH